VLASIGWPVLDRIHLFGDFAISPHGIGIAVGFLFGAWILQHEGPKRGVTVEHINTMVFWALIGTIIGARLFFVIGHFSEFDGVADMLALWNGGLTLLGGIAGAILINIPLFRRYHYSFFQVMDGAVIGLAFGAVYGATRVLEDFLRVDKRVFGLTGSQWTGLTVSIVCIVTLIAWAVGARSSPGEEDRAPSGDADRADRSVP
jgi:prolipoprotein diacylglyceryltransferase